MDKAKLRNVGLESLDKFVLAVAKVAKKHKFNILLAGGDSGQITAWIASEVMNQVAPPAPTKCVLPIYRHADYKETILFDNQVFIYDLAQAIKAVDQPLDALIVDDEVGSGVSVGALVNLIKAVSIAHQPHITFIAEDGGFNSQNSLANIEFISSKKREEGVYNAISHLIPAQFGAPVGEALTNNIEDMNDKHVMNILLGLPVKEFNHGKPVFTNRYEKIVSEKLPELARLKNGFQTYLISEISKSLMQMNS